MSWQSGGVIALAVAVVVAALVTDGFRNERMDLDESSVWVTHAQLGRAGRFVVPIQQIDMMAQVAMAPNLIQDGREVATWTEGGRLATIDPTTGEARGGTDLPTQADVEFGGGTVAVIDRASGAVWTSDLASATALRMVAPADEETADESGAPEQPAATEAPDNEGGDGGEDELELSEPSLAASPGATLAVGPTGAVWVLDPAGPVLQRVGDDEPVEVKIGIDGAQLVVVGEVPVVLSPASDELQFGEQVVDLSGHGNALQLQDGPAYGKSVLVATNTKLLEISAGGDVSSLGDAVFDAAPIRPVRVQGCAWSAWPTAAEGSILLACDSKAQQSVTYPVEANDGTEAVFRVNRNNVVLNLPQSGAAGTMVDGKIRLVRDWPSDEVDDHQEQEDDEERTNETSDECAAAEPNQPPQAADDSFGARLNVATVLDVLGNDTDPECDIRTVDEIANVSDPSAIVERTDRGQAIQFRASDPSVTRVSFSYSVTDGRDGNEPSWANVEVTVAPADGNNHAPELVRDDLEVSVTLGSSVTYNVLTAFRDPDGDPIVLTAASLAEGSTGTIRSQSDGTITFLDDGIAAIEKNVSLIVSDGQASTPGVLRIRVLEESDPIARNDFAVARVGINITIDPLANDAGTNGEAPRLVAGPAERPEGVSVEADTFNGLVSFKSTVPGTFIFPYTIGAGGKSAIGAIRVDVVDANPTNLPPTPMRDVVAVAANRSAVVDVVANDFDPDFDVLVVESIDAPKESGMNAQLLENRAIRVNAGATTPQPVIIRYLVSDGVNGSVEGELQVIVVDGGLNQPPVVRNDIAVVRAGQLVNVPVLTNDSDPEGTPLVVSVPDDPALAFNLTPGAAEPGIVFTDGTIVRFIAGPEPGSASVNYTATDADGKAVSGLIQITILAADAPNQPPVPRSVEARLVGNRPVEIKVPRDGIDPDGDPVTFGVASLPAKGGAEWSDSCGCFIYTPAYGAVGTDQFDYYADDGRGGRLQATVRIGLIAIAQNRPPVPLPDVVRMRPDSTQLVDVLRNDEDPERDPIELVSVSAKGQATDVLAEVDSNYVKVITEGVGEAAFDYVITDGGAEVASSLQVIVDENAPLLAPIALDDDEEACDIETRARCDVLANDTDPDGDASNLTLALVGAPSGVTIDGRFLVIEPGEAARVVAYRITDTDGLFATAIVRIPGTVQNLPPKKKDGTPVIEIPLGEEALVNITDYVEDPEGKPVQLGSEVVQLVNGSVVIDSTTRLRVIAPAEVPGATTLSFEVTDGTSATDPEGRRAQISLDVMVTGTVNRPPRFVSFPVEVPKDGESVSVDLIKMVQDDDPDGMKAILLKGLASTGTGIDSSLDGTIATFTVTNKDVPNATFAITVVDGDLPEVEHTFPVTVIASKKSTATVRPLSIEAEHQVPITVDIAELVSVDESLLPISVSNASMKSGVGEVSVSGTTLTVTPVNEQGGSAQVSFVVNDRLNDVTREVPAAIDIVVKNVPAKPAAPTLGAPGDEYVVLSWVAPLDGGASITNYRIGIYSDGGLVRTVDTDGAVTNFELNASHGITNAVPYRFTVQAFNDVKDGWSEPSPESAVITPDTVPSKPSVPPTLTYAPTLASGELQVTWPKAGSAQWENRGSSVTEYQLIVTPPPSNTSQLTITDGRTSTTLTGLVDGQEYRVQVRAKNAESVKGGWSEASDASAPESPASKPAKIARPTATRVEDPLGGRATVTWVEPRRNSMTLEGYIVKTTSSSGAALPDVQVAADKTNVQVNAPNKASYTFQVIAINKAGQSEASDPSVSLVGYGKPAVPAAPTLAANGTDGVLTVTVRPSDNNGRAIEFFRIEIGGRVEWLAANGAASQTVAYGDFSNSQSYKARVSACNRGQEAAYCSDLSGVSNTDNPYGKPTLPRVSLDVQSDTAGSFTWGGGDGNGREFSHYEVTASDRGLFTSGAGGINVRRGCDVAPTLTVQYVTKAGTKSDPVTVRGTSGPCPSVTASWGAAYSTTGCASGCQRITLQLRNFAPNKAVAVTCQYRVSSNANWDANFGYDPPDITVDGNGNADYATYCTGNTTGNWEYRGVVDGVASNGIG